MLYDSVFSSFQVENSKAIENELSQKLLAEQWKNSVLAASALKASAPSTNASSNGSAVVPSGGVERQLENNVTVSETKSGSRESNATGDRTRDQLGFETASHGERQLGNQARGEVGKDAKETQFAANDEVKLSGVEGQVSNVSQGVAGNDQSKVGGLSGEQDSENMGGRLKKEDGNMPGTGQKAPSGGESVESKQDLNTGHKLKYRRHRLREAGLGKGSETNFERTYRKSMQQWGTKDETQLPGVDIGLGRREGPPNPAVGRVENTLEGGDKEEKNQQKSGPENEARNENTYQQNQQPGAGNSGNDGAWGSAGDAPKIMGGENIGMFRQRGGENTENETLVQKKPRERRALEGGGFESSQEGGEGHHFGEPLGRIGLDPKASGVWGAGRGTGLDTGAVVKVEPPNFPAKIVGYEESGSNGRFNVCFILSCSL